MTADERQKRIDERVRAVQRLGLFLGDLHLRGACEDRILLELEVGLDLLEVELGVASPAVLDLRCGSHVAGGLVARETELLLRRREIERAG